MSMKSFNRLDLLKNFNLLESRDQFKIYDKNVDIVLEKKEDGTIDLDRFYSRVSIPGYARCSLYYMLKEIVEKIDNIDRNTLIGISVIAPSEPRRNIESIKKTYRNMGFKKFKDLKHALCPDIKFCSAKFEKIGDILEALKNCDPEFNRFENRKTPSLAYTDAELLDFQATDNISRRKYRDEELLKPVVTSATRNTAGLTRKKHSLKSAIKRKQLRQRRSKKTR